MRFQKAVQRPGVSFRERIDKTADLARDLGLAAHRVDGHQGPGNLDDFQQFRDDRDLIALGVDHHLTETDVIGGGPGADHVNRRLATGRVEAAAERLAVDGNHLPAGHLVQGRDPTQQALLKFRRLDGRQNRIKAVVRRNALLEIEKACEPLALLPAEMRDGHEIIGTTDHRAYRNHHDVDQRIGHAATAWIGKRGEVILNRDRLLLRHGIGSWTAATPAPLPLLEQATESQSPNHTKLPSMAQLPCYQASLLILRVGTDNQSLAFVGADDRHAPAFIDHVCFAVDDFNPDRILATLADFGVTPRADESRRPAPLKSYVTMRMPDRGGAPRGTPELYFTDPDGILLQVQDVRYCCGGGYLGDERGTPKAPRE